MRIVIVMPTFNEKENISQMIEVLAGKVFPNIKKHQMMLLVVDGHSPDGTWQVVQEKCRKYKNVRLLDEGKKGGLGQAYISGFNFAIKKLQADAIMEMDADFQHDPNDISRFVVELDRGYDYILGSRNIKGGSIPKDWGFKRTFLSVVGNLFLRVSLLTWSLHDFTTGYRLSRVKGFLDEINFEKVFSRSYSYKVRLLHEMMKRGARIKEIPIKFFSREKGWSKMDSEDFFEQLKVIGVIWADRLGLNKR